MCLLLIHKPAFNQQQLDSGIFHTLFHDSVEEHGFSLPVWQDPVQQAVPRGKQPTFSQAVPA